MVSTDHEKGREGVVVVVCPAPMLLANFAPLDYAEKWVKSKFVDISGVRQRISLGQ